jgi:hypothetical protein
MQKLRKDHAKQVKKLKPGTRNNVNVRPTPPRPASAAKNLDTAIAKMKAAQKKFNNDKKARTVRLVSAKK